MTLRVGFIIATIIGLTACGSGQSARASSEDTLTSTPISFGAATGKTAEMLEVGPCPFVSDDVMISSVRSRFEIVRREVSNTNCRWSYNAGFVIDVTIEDLATARPVSTRRYNMDIDPVLSPKDGPGTNAAVLNDTAWDRPVPYAYSFEKDGKLVFIRYTGFKTDAEIMRPAADEIARRMGDAHAIEPQRRQLAVSFEACEVWSKQDLATVFGTSENALIEPGRRSLSTCAWDIFEDGVNRRRTAAFHIYEPEPGKKQEYEYSSYTAYTENDETHYLRKSDSHFGLYVHIVTPRPQGIVHVTVSDTSGDPTSVAKRLQSNLLNRLVD